MINTFWQDTKKLSILGKLRQSITLEAFCVRVGERNASLNFTGLSGAMQFLGYSGVDQYLDTAFTMECWFKTFSGFPNYGVLFANSDGANIQTALALKDERFYVQIVTAGAVIKSFTSAMKHTQGEWAHVAITFDGDRIRLYQNGVKDVNELILAENIAPGAVMTTVGNFAAQNRFVGKIAEIRMWNTVLTQSQIKYGMNKRRGKNVGLKRYYRLNEYVTPSRDYLDSARTSTAPFTSSGISVDQEDYPPLITGASSLGAVWDIIAGQNISLKYPVKKPDDVEFTLCVSYVDEETETRVRYKLWDDELDIAPIPVRYRGQVLPTSFRFEAWGRDGAEEAELFEDLIIYLSKVTLAQNQRDVTNIALIDPNPVIDITLADPWGSLFPLDFNTQSQFGTCAAPIEQDLTVMADDLPVYGGNDGLAIGILNEDGGPALNEDGGRQMLET